MSIRESRTLERDLEATAIPYGEKVPLKKGSTLFVMQALGGSFTAMSDQGYMVRIEGKDADAIGEEVQAGPTVEELQSKPLSDLVWDQLRTCYDPEIPVNIVDLGLVYDMRISPEGDENRVDVKMTLTAQGCGMGASIAADARHKILALPGVTDAAVDIVWDPPWTPQMISPDGRERLGMA